MANSDRLTFKSQIMDGRACIRRKRILVSTILNRVAHGQDSTRSYRVIPGWRPSKLLTARMSACHFWLMPVSMVG